MNSPCEMSSTETWRLVLRQCEHNHTIQPPFACRILEFLCNTVPIHMCPGSDTPVSFYRYILPVEAIFEHSGCTVYCTAPVYRRRRERQVRESADSRAADNITAIHADYCVPRFSWRELLDHWNSICLLIDASF